MKIFYQKRFVSNWTNSNAKAVLKLTLQKSWINNSDLARSKYRGTQGCFLSCGKRLWGTAMEVLGSRLFTRSKNLEDESTAVRASSLGQSKDFNLAEFRLECQWDCSASVALLVVSLWSIHHGELPIMSWNAIVPLTNIPPPPWTGKWHAGTTWRWSPSTLSRGKVNNSRRAL
jgi:hypothetical protein